MNAICEEGNVGRGKHISCGTVTVVAVLYRSRKFWGNINYGTEMAVMEVGKWDLQTTRRRSAGRTTGQSAWKNVWRESSGLLENCIGDRNWNGEVWKIHTRISWFTHEKLTHLHIHVCAQVTHTHIHVHTYIEMYVYT
jgi:hypothetical protein